MESIRQLVEIYLKAAWRRRWLGVATAWVICAIGWAGVHMMPNQYESTARLYVDADAILTPLLRGLAADSSPMSQLDILQRTLLSGPNLEKLIGKTDLDLTITAPGDRERMVQTLATAIKVIPQTKNLFTISYRNTNPKLAYDVVQTLLTIFIESATGANRSDMENARRFLEHQISSYEQQLRSAERRRAEFRSKYVNMLPEDGNVANVVDAARGRVRGLEGQLQDATLRRDALKVEFTNTPQLLVVDRGAVGPNGQFIAAPPTRLEQAEQALTDLRLRYTDLHPDVIAQRKLIAELKSNPVAAGRVAAAPAGGPAAQAAIGGEMNHSVPNPVFDQIKMRLLEADGNVGSLQRQLDEARQDRDRVEKIQHDQPNLLAEFQNLDRDYNVLRKNYDELVGRLQQANIAQAADTQADKVKLQIVDPPQTSRVPVAPNRLLLVSAVLLIGLGAGVALPVLFTQLDRSYATVDELRKLGFPVLGSITSLAVVSRRKRVLAAFRFSAAILLLMVAFGGVLAQILRASTST
jgi:polysaccharide chain length determinant protein (PEP-CTERM system associated)